MSVTQSRIISADQMRLAVASIPRSIQTWQGEEGPRLELTIAPGVVRLSRRDRGAAERAFNRRHADRLEEVRALRDRGLYPGGMTGARRDSITSFTRQARARMVRTLCTLDYTPLFEHGERPAMVTLTLPGEWERIAPDAREFKKLVKRFQDRYSHSFGRPLVGVWKLEFQRRGAPHLHILMSPPSHRSQGEGLDFRTWLSRNWAGACGTAKILGPEEAQKHVNAGTGIDYDTNGQWADAKRIAIYYAKHGLFGAKEYQNEAPQLWLDAGSVGRFWGYWGLKKGGATVELDMRKLRHDPSAAERLDAVVQKCRDAGIPVTGPLLGHVENRIINGQVPHEYASLDRYIERYLRRRARQQSYFERVQVDRVSVNPLTGEIRERKRWVRRRRTFYTGGSGFLVVNDGLAAAAEIEQIIRWWLSVTGHELDAFTMYDELHRAHDAQNS